MTLKRSVFGTYVKDGLSHEKKGAEQRKKGFRAPPKRKIKLKNPFQIYNHMFNFNKDYTKVPTLLSKNKSRKKSKRNR